MGIRGIGWDKLHTVIFAAGGKMNEKDPVTPLCWQLCPRQRHARRAALSPAPDCWDTLRTLHSDLQITF